MAKRFKSLKKSLRYLQNPGGTSSNTPPAGSVLETFQKVISGQTKVTYGTRDNTSKQGGMLRKAVHPFGLSGLDDYALCKVSKRAFESGNITAQRAKCYIKDDTEVQISRFVGFKPATAIIFVGTGTSTLIVDGSKYTGIKYSRRNGNSFALPFGKSVAGDSFAEIREGIIATIVANMSISFESEDSPLL